MNNSRMVITFDAPSNYIISLNNMNGGLIAEHSYHTKPGLNVGYEHMIIEGAFDGKRGLFMFFGVETYLFTVFG